MKKVLLLVFIGALFVACKPEKQFADELKTIDTYKSELDSVKKAFSAIKMDSVFYIRKTASEAERFIKTNYITDTINIDFANKISYMKRIRKSLANFEMNTKHILLEAEAIDTQYVHLKTDILNGVLNKKQVDTYLLEEKVALDNLKKLFNQVNENQSTQMANFYFAYPTVEEYITLIKNTN
ncbi:hypothetical protein [Putridiphycobacter roseus]|nr:hypothetical protein [Putridiphycobacter roseus]